MRIIGSGKRERSENIKGKRYGRNEEGKVECRIFGETKRKKG